MQISVFLNYEEVLNHIHNQGDEVQISESYQNNIVLNTKAAHDRICKYLGYEIVTSVYTTEYQNGNGTNKLFTNNRPITAVTSLYNDTDLIPVSDYILFDNYILLKDSISIVGEANYKISYTAGWTRTTMPYDIKRAGLRLVSLYLDTVNREGKSSVSSGQTSETINLDAEKQILETISDYRIMNRL